MRALKEYQRNSKSRPTYTKNLIVWSFIHTFIWFNFIFQNLFPVLDLHVDQAFQQQYHFNGLRQNRTQPGMLTMYTFYSGLKCLLKTCCCNFSSTPNSSIIYPKPCHCRICTFIHFSIEKWNSLTPSKQLNTPIKYIYGAVLPAKQFEFLFIQSCNLHSSAAQHRHVWQGKRSCLLPQPVVVQWKEKQQTAELIPLSLCYILLPNSLLED